MLVTTTPPLSPSQHHKAAVSCCCCRQKEFKRVDGCYCCLPYGDSPVRLVPHCTAAVLATGSGDPLRLSLPRGGPPSKGLLGGPPPSSELLIAELPPLVSVASAAGAPLDPVADPLGCCRYKGRAPLLLALVGGPTPGEAPPGRGAPLAAGMLLLLGGPTPSAWW